MLTLQSLRRRLTLLCLLAVAAVPMAFGANAPPGTAIGRWMQPSWTSISPEARIFLVAGARDNANFAQEIVDQRKFWLAAGYTAEQIACFYAVPNPSQRDDVQQFLSLESELRDCHLASPEIIFAALAAAAEGYRHEYFYLYVTSHGTGPALTWPLTAQDLRHPGWAWYVQARDEAYADRASDAYAWLSPYRIEIEGVGASADERWSWASFNRRYVNLRVAEPGTRAENHLFTPRFLARALQAFPPAVSKIVVLQGCHSGGFVLPPDEAPDPEETLLTVQNITVLTASRADRTSFGCGSDDHTTYYGGSLQQILNTAPERRVTEWDWRLVHDEVSLQVEQLESEQEIRLLQRSLPQFFSNRR